MKAFGYTKDNVEAESPSELREISLILSVDEIELLILFFQHVKGQFETSSPTSGQSHIHLRDWWNKWAKPNPDLVIVFRG
jgi:hypothetical protein